MKKFTRTMALALVMAMMLSMTAFAAPKVEEVVEDTVDATVATTGDYAGKKLDELTYSDDRIAADGQYMIFVVNKEGGTYLPTASSILYINQMQATEAGKITFENIFPKTMKNSGIMISGTGLTGPELIAMILAALMGDIDGDGIYTATDATEVLRKAVGLSSLIDTESLPLWMGDIDNDGIYTATDATEILRKAVGLSSLLDAQ